MELYQSKNIGICLAFLLSMCFMVKEASASHLMGGSIEYEFVSETFPGSGVYTYRVIIKTYTNCDSTSFVPFPENFIRLGVYHESDNPNDDKELFQSSIVFLTDSNRISPEVTVGCGVGFGTCIYEGVYETTVDLPDINNLGNPSNGYHFVYIRCCRNSSIINLTNASSQGMVFWAYLGPPDLRNSSPTFDNQPLPFICIGDSVSISNAAAEIDGDSLVYGFIDPFDQYVGQTSAAPSPPSPLSWPLQVITWQVGGFSANSPFGPGGLATLNSSSGLADYFIPTQSNYVVGVEIKEFRNGIQIGAIRRDIQFLGLQCPPNGIPHFGPQSSSGQSAFSIEEGDQLCFQILFNDSNNDGTSSDDSIFITTSGNLFDPLFTNPSATVSLPSAGVSPFFRQFCWTPGCDKGQSLPYTFTANATDNGCPNKTTPVIYTINVSPFIGPTMINGPDSVCTNQVNSIYSVDSIPGAVNTWTITGGIIGSGTGTHEIIVDWGTGAIGSIKYYAQSPFGCPSDTLSKMIAISGSILIDAGISDTICIGDSVGIGGPTSTPSGSQAIWAPSNSLNDNTIPDPIAFPTQTTKYFLLVTDSGGCTAIDSVNVIVENIPNINVTNDASICPLDSFQLNVSVGLTFNWSPGSLVSDSTISNPIAFPTTSTEFIIFITDSSGCGGLDTVNITVQPTAGIITSSPIWYCKGDSTTIDVQGGVSFTWSPPIFLSNTNQSSVVTIATDSIQYFVNIVDNIGCSFRDSIKVIVDTIIPTVAGLNEIACIGDTFTLGGSPTVSGNQTSVQWTPNTFFIDSDTLLNPRVFPTSAQTYFVTSVNGQCTGSDSVSISLQPKPVVTAGSDINSCAGSMINFSGSTATNYLWIFGDGDSSALALPSHLYADTGVFEVIYIGFDSLGCSNSDSLHVNLNFITSIIASGDTSICEGELTSIAVNGNANSFSWVPSSGLDNSNSTSPNVNVSVTTTYTVTGIDTNSCTAQDSVTIVIFNTPSITIINDTTSCSGDSIQLFSSGGGNYLWQPITGLSNSTINNPIAFPEAPVKYIVKIVDSNNCVHFDSVNVSIGVEPIAQFTNWVEPNCDDIKLIGLNQSTNSSSYQWTYGTEVSNSMNFSSIYNSKVDSITLIVQSNTSCSDTLTLPITHVGENLDDILTNVIPNVFSPNNDGLNEWFEISVKNHLHDCTELRIFDRWGHLVFTSIGNYHSWNGWTFDGQEASDGTFFYILEVNGLNFTGHVILVR